MKLSIGLGIALLLVVSGSYVLIGNLNDEIAILKGNAIVLEGEVQRQNEQIKKNLAQQQKTYAQIDSLTKKNQENMREVNALKQTFARHDLDALAMAKPIDNFIYAPFFKPPPANLEQEQTNSRPTGVG